MFCLCVRGFSNGVFRWFLRFVLKGIGGFSYLSKRL